MRLKLQECYVGGLDNLLTKQTPPVPQDYEGRIQTLQEHLDATKSLHTESRGAADQAIQDLNKANERIIALETAQSKSVQDLLSLQSRLSQTLNQLHALQDEHGSLSNDQCSTRIGSISDQTCRTQAITLRASPLCVSITNGGYSRNIQQTP